MQALREQLLVREEAVIGPEDQKSSGRPRSRERTRSCDMARRGQRVALRPWVSVGASGWRGEGEVTAGGQSGSAIVSCQC